MTEIDNGELVKKLRTGNLINQDTGKLATVEELTELAPNFAMTVPPIMWMKMIRDMRATMLKAADALAAPAPAAPAEAVPTYYDRRDAALEEAEKIARKYIDRPLGDPDNQDTQSAFDEGMTYTTGALDAAIAIAEAISARRSRSETMTEVSEQWLRGIYADQLDIFKQHEHAECIRHNDPDIIDVAALAAMKVATGELLAKLEPFARYGDSIATQGIPDACPLFIGPGKVKPWANASVGDLRAASAAVAKATELQRPSAGGRARGDGRNSSRRSNPTADDRTPPVGPAPTRTENEEGG